MLSAAVDTCRAEGGCVNHGLKSLYSQGRGIFFHIESSSIVVSNVPCTFATADSP